MCISRHVACNNVQHDGSQIHKYKEPVSVHLSWERVSSCVIKACRYIFFIFPFIISPMTLTTLYEKCTAVNITLIFTVWHLSSVNVFPPSHSWKMSASFHLWSWITVFYSVQVLRSAALTSMPLHLHDPFLPLRSHVNQLEDVSVKKFHAVLQ